MTIVSTLWSHDWALYKIDHAWDINLCDFRVKVVSHNT